MGPHNIDCVLICGYLYKNYRIEDGKFIFKHDESSEDIYYIKQSLSDIFSVDVNFCEEAIKLWAYSNHMTPKEFNELYLTRTPTAIIYYYDYNYQDILD